MYLNRFICKHTFRNTAMHPASRSIARKYCRITKPCSSPHHVSRDSTPIPKYTHMTKRFYFQNLAICRHKKGAICEAAMDGRSFEFSVGICFMVTATIWIEDWMIFWSAPLPPSFHKQGDPNTHPQILQSLLHLWLRRAVDGFRPH